LTGSFRYGAWLARGGVGLGNLLGVTPIGQEDNIAAIRVAISGLEDRVGIAIDSNDAYQKAIDFLNGQLGRRPNFLVDKNGKLWARGADIMGDISVTDGGKIGDFTINDGDIVGSFAGNNVRVSSKNLPTLDSLLNVTTQQITGITAGNSGLLSVSGSYNDFGSGGWVVEEDVYKEWQVNGSFTLQQSTVCWFNFDIIDVSLSQSGGATINGHHYLILQNTANPNSRIPIASGVSILIPAGTYRVILVFEAWFIPGSIGSGAGMLFRLRFNGGFFGENNKETIFATDGIASFLNQNAFFYFSNDHGLEIRMGSHGLKCSINGGLQKRLANGTWQNL
jgi:hypothetical protein